jgi:uncharacterized protein (DUF2147 family)
MITRTLSKVALMLWLASPAYAGEAIYGVWIRGGHEDEKLDFYDCEGQLCAKAAVPPPDGSPAVLILRHAAKTAPNQWKGPIFNPENGKLYSATVTLDKPNEMTLKGCLIAFLCQSETWTRDTTAPPDKAGAPSQDKAGPGPAKTTTNPGTKTEPSPTKAAPSSAKTAPTPAKAAPSTAKSPPAATKPAPGTDKKPPAADKKPPDADPAQ